MRGMSEGVQRGLGKEEEEGLHYTTSSGAHCCNLPTQIGQEECSCVQGTLGNLFLTGDYGKSRSRSQVFLAFLPHQPVPGCTTILCTSFRHGEKVWIKM